MELDDTLKILILRTLKLTQEEVAERLHRARQTVGDAERWFNSCPPGDAAALVDDYRIKRLVGREFPGMGLTDDRLIRAGQITGDDILLHYGLAFPSDKGEAAANVEPATRVDPVYRRLLTIHWGRLRQLTIIFREQLTPPGTEQLITAEVCRKAYQARQSGVPLLSPDSWTGVIEAPLEFRLSPGPARKRTVAVRLSVEAEVLFPHLAVHLEAEPGGFPRFGAWKTRLGRLVQICLDSAAAVTGRYHDAAGRYYQGANIPRGLFFRGADYIGQFVLDHPSGGVPVLGSEPQAERMWRIMPLDRPGITLALVPEDHINRCQEVLINQVRENARLPVWPQIREEVARLQTGADQLRSRLTTVIERGDFKGTCPLCAAFFNPDPGP